jgi:hypothetical protein
MSNPNERIGPPIYNVDKESLIKGLQIIRINDPEVKQNLENDEEVLPPEKYVQEVISWGNFIKNVATGEANIKESIFLSKIII